MDITPDAYLVDSLCQMCLPTTAVACKGQGHSPLLQLLLYGQQCPDSLHKFVKDVLGALELLLLLGYVGLRLESDVLHVLERGASPGKGSEGLGPTAAQPALLSSIVEIGREFRSLTVSPQMRPGKKKVGLMLAADQVSQDSCVARSLGRLTFYKKGQQLPGQGRRKRSQTQ